MSVTDSEIACFLDRAFNDMIMTEVENMGLANTVPNFRSPSPLRELKTRTTQYSLILPKKYRRKSN